MLTTSDSPAAVGMLWGALGGLEDHAAATGWAWDAVLSLVVDALRVRLDGNHA